MLSVSALALVILGGRSLADIAADPETAIDPNDAVLAGSRLLALGLFVLAVFAVVLAVQLVRAVYWARICVNVLVAQVLLLMVLMAIGVPDLAGISALFLMIGGALLWSVNSRPARAFLTRHVPAPAAPVMGTAESVR
jgi:hypothetical protein